MPAAYLVSHSEVHDPALMQEYAKLAGPTSGPYGGELLASSTEVAHMDGAWKPSRLVIFRFPSMEKAKAWYNSPEYQAIVDMRLKAAHSSLVFVEGVD